MNLCNACETVASCKATGCKPVIDGKLFAVYEQVNDVWYFKKAFTSSGAANEFLFLHTHMANVLTVVTFVPEGNQ